MIAQALEIHNQRNIETSADIVLSNVRSSENIPHDLEKNSPRTVEKIELPKESNLETEQENHSEEGRYMLDSCNKSFNEFNEMDYEIPKVNYSDLQDVESVIDADLRSIIPSIIDTHGLCNDDAYETSQRKVDNYATDMETGLLMEYRPYGHGYPSWVGDWIPVGEPVKSEDSFETSNESF